MIISVIKKNYSVRRKHITKAFTKSRRITWPVSSIWPLTLYFPGLPTSLLTALSPFPCLQHFLCLTFKYLPRTVMLYTGQFWFMLAALAWLWLVSPLTLDRVWVWTINDLVTLSLGDLIQYWRIKLNICILMAPKSVCNLPLFFFWSIKRNVELSA